MRKYQESAGKSNILDFVSIVEGILDHSSIKQPGRIQITGSGTSHRYFAKKRRDNQVKHREIRSKKLNNFLVAKPVIPHNRQVNSLIGVHKTKITHTSNELLVNGTFCNYGSSLLQRKGSWETQRRPLKFISPVWK